MVGRSRGAGGATLQPTTPAPLEGKLRIAGGSGGVGGLPRRTSSIALGRPPRSRSLAAAKAPRRRQSKPEWTAHPGSQKWGLHCQPHWKGPVLRALRIPEQSWVQASAEPSDRGLTTVPQIHGAFSMEQEGGDQVSLMPKPIFWGVGVGTVRGTRIYQKPLKREHAHSSSLSPARFTSTRIINFFVCGSAARRQCSYCTKLKV